MPPAIGVSAVSLAGVHTRQEAAVLASSGERLLGQAPAGKSVLEVAGGGAASPEAVTALVCALAGYLTERSLQPPPPGLPTIRAFQAAHAAIARQWLTQRL